MIGVISLDNLFAKKFPFAKCSINITNGTFVLCNENFTLFTGYDTELLCKNNISFFDIISIDISTSMLQKQLEDFKEICFNAQLKCLDTTSSNFILYANLRDNSDSDIVDIVLIPDKNQLRTDKDKSEIKSNSLNYDLLFDKISCGIVIYDIFPNALKMFFSTKKFFDIIGYTKEEYLEITNGGYIGKLIHDEDKEWIGEKISDLFEHGGSFSEQLRMIKKDGSIVFVYANGTTYTTDEGKKRFMVSYTDITQNKIKDNLLDTQIEKYKILEDIADDIMFDYDVNNDTATIPQQYSHFFGKKERLEGYLKHDMAKLNVHPDDYWKYITVIRSASMSPQKNKIDIRTKTFGDEYQWFRFHYVSIPDLNGKISHIYGRIENIDKEKQWMLNNAENEKIITKLSSTDYVTGLYNRHTFQEKAKKIIKNHDFKTCIALVYSDINNFSYINDNFGYDAGDNMLFDFSALINKCEVNVIGSRINSDYFAVIATGSSEREIVSMIEERDKAFVNLQKKKYAESEIGLATGIYFIKRNDEDIKVILDNANLARRHVKSNKNTNICIYNDSLRYARNHAKMIISKLKPAIDEGMIEMFLQPKFSIKTRKIVGAEALARWRNQDGTYKYPGQFIDVLEQSGYIGDLDFYIYETALKQIQKWNILGKKPIPISVNFSRINNNNKNFTKRIIDLAEKYGVAQNYIELEITESAFSENSKSMLENMKILREKGFKVDIDDFGIGYSSLSFLLDAPIDVVKVDKLFVDNIDVSSRHREYLKQMCILINTTEKNIIFEGVETESQADFLNSCGFDCAQGWLFDKAINITEFEKKYID